jgi:hypothetical protein
MKYWRNRFVKKLFLGFGVPESVGGDGNWPG